MAWRLLAWELVLAGAAPGAGAAGAIEALAPEVGAPARNARRGPVPAHTVSGVSSGGDMAVNHLVAFSRSVTGAAIVAGAPYGCNLVENGDADWCGAGDPSVPWSLLLARLSVHLRLRAMQGLVDPPSSLQGRRVYLFSGLLDPAVHRGVMEALREQLGGLTGYSSLVADFDVPATHGWVVDGRTCTPGQEPGSPGSPCSACCCEPGALLVCPGHDLAGRLLWHLSGGGRGQFRGANATGAGAGGGAAVGRWLAVPQAWYLPEGLSLEKAGLWTFAYVYAPAGCYTLGTGGCQVHVHYHGCAWGAQFTGFDIIGRLGLLAWADLLRIVLVFPQASDSIDPAGCWDWTGETSPLFDTQLGPQLATVTSLVADLPRLLVQGGGARKTFGPEGRSATTALAGEDRSATTVVVGAGPRADASEVADNASIWA